MYKLKSVVLASLSLSLLGCGGSDEGEAPTSIPRALYSYGITTSTIDNWFDVQIYLNNNWEEQIGSSRITVTFDIDNNGTFNDGDIHLVAGNGSGIGTYGSWTSSTDFFIEYTKAGQNYRVREFAGIIIGGGINNIFVNNIGGVWTYTLSQDDVISERSLALRVNKDISSSEPILAEIKQQLNSITPSTPVNVVINDGEANPSLDFSPAEHVYSQQSNGHISDPANDYIGNKSWVDIISVEFSHGSE
ncbi:hypothetical protein ACQEXU_06950 [Vibrio sp. TRT 21S02]|uniref:hypothetical protein n=1 Tax=Vibrio sp. TRT 21S02 TaxID=3418507 RepID=UPI003CEBC92E